MNLDSLNLNSRDESLNLTQPGFATEADAEEHLKQFLTRTNCFQIFQQHPATLLRRHHKQSSLGNLRCDLLLVPTSSEIQTGCIVIEVKKSGVTIGPALSQLMDYLNCSFQLRNGIHVIPTYGFLFPCHKQCKATASVMSHQNLGSCSLHKYGISFHSGEEFLFGFDVSGALSRVRESNCGTRTGAR